MRGHWGRRGRRDRGEKVQEGRGGREGARRARTCEAAEIEKNINFHLSFLISDFPLRLAHQPLPCVLMQPAPAAAPPPAYQPRAIRDRFEGNSPVPGPAAQHGRGGSAKRLKIAHPGGVPPTTTWSASRADDGFAELFDLGDVSNLHSALERPGKVMGLVAKRLCSAHPGPVVRVVCVADGCGYDLPRGELRVRLPWLGGVLASRANRLGVGEGVSAVDPVELPECADNSSALLMLVEHMWGGGGRLVAAGDVEMARYALHSGSFFDFPALVERGERRIREIGVTAETAAALLADGDCFGLGGL